LWQNFKKIPKNQKQKTKFFLFKNLKIQKQKKNNSKKYKFHTQMH